MPSKKNIKIDMNIKLIRKFSEIYFEIFGKYRYSVQVLYVKNKNVALQKRDALIKDGYKNAYCEAVPIIPNRGYMYKVKIGDYDTLSKARKILSKIKNKYKMLSNSFVTARQIKN